MVRHILIKVVLLATVAIVGCSQEVASPRTDGPAKLEIMHAPALEAQIMDDSQPSHAHLPVNDYSPRATSGSASDRRLRSTSPPTLPSDAQLLGIDELLPGAFRVPEAPPMKTLPMPMPMVDMAG